MIVDMDKNECGAHHCTRENISYQVAHLKDVESGKEPVGLQDWRTDCGVMALQFKWLLAHLDD